MNKFIEILIFGALFTGIYCIDFEDCGTTTGRVTAITVSGCDASSAACAFKTGTNVSIDVNFQSEVNTNTATVKIWGIIGGVPIPFNLKPSDACGHWNINCPLVSGNAYELKISMPILTQYPRIHVEVRVALLDSNNNKLLCRQFPAQIQ